MFKKLASIIDGLIDKYMTERIETELRAVLNKKKREFNVRLKNEIDAMTDEVVKKQSVLVAESARTIIYLTIFGVDVRPNEYKRYQAWMQEFKEMKDDELVDIFDKKDYNAKKLIAAELFARRKINMIDLNKIYPNAALINAILNIDKRIT